LLKMHVVPLPSERCTTLMRAGCEHRAGQVQPGTGWEGQVVDHAFAAQGDGHLRDRAGFGAALLAGGHRHVGGTEIDQYGAEGGDARAAAQREVADGHLLSR
jgi:hypothetical protein